MKNTWTLVHCSLTGVQKKLVSNCGYGRILLFLIIYLSSNKVDQSSCCSQVPRKILSYTNQTAICHHSTKQVCVCSKLSTTLHQNNLLLITAFPCTSPHTKLRPEENHYKQWLSTKAKPSKENWLLHKWRKIYKTLSRYNSTDSVISKIKCLRRALTLPKQYASFFFIFKTASHCVALCG